MGYLIALKFCTQIGGVRAHLGTKFDWNAINTCEGTGVFAIIHKK